MTRELIDEPRLLLYFDLLGFKNLVREQSPGKVYEIVSRIVRQAKRHEEKRPAFKSIYFSDTIIIYQKASGFDIERFDELLDIGNQLFRGLLSRNIPANGMMTYGQFIVRNGANDTSIYFGKALIDAYEADKREKWIGFVLHPSVSNEIKAPVIEKRRSSREWKSRGISGKQYLLVNTFIELHRHHEWLIGNQTPPIKTKPILKSLLGSIKTEKSLDALGFLLTEANNLTRSGQYTSKIAARYLSSLRFARDILKIKCFKWASELAMARRSAVGKN